MLKLLPVCSSGAHSSLVYEMAYGILVFTFDSERRVQEDHHSSRTAHLVKADCMRSFSPRLGRGISRLSQTIENHQLLSVDPENVEGMIHLKEAESIAFQK